jgi:hypothetical protein
MRHILPPGYSLHQQRIRLEAELRRARADELASASVVERAGIEKEIQAQVRKQIGEKFPRCAYHVPVMWGL